MDLCIREGFIFKELGGDGSDNSRRKRNRRFTNERLTAGFLQFATVKYYSNLTHDRLIQNSFIYM